jgi:hypothetical protein
MTRGLVALLVIVQAADYLTYLGAPHLESNPLMAALPPLAVGVVKAAGVLLALAVVRRMQTPSLQSLALGLGVAVGAFGLGTNVASLLG